jgi:hypothetical protein
LRVFFCSRLAATRWVVPACTYSTLLATCKQRPTGQGGQAMGGRAGSVGGGVQSAGRHMGAAGQHPPTQASHLSSSQQPPRSLTQIKHPPAPLCCPASPLRLHQH